MTEFAYGEGSGEEGPSVPGFRVVRRIGTGGFSTVYEAVQEDVDAPVAIKILNVDAADSRTRTRLERECRSMGRLRDQPGIVAVYRAAFTTDGRPAVVMAHLPGGSLADRLDHGPLPPHEVATIGTTIARALDAAHRQGIYHRDIKPENILLDRDGQPHLADFGLALIDDLTNSTQTDSTLTPPHAPPERFITAPAGDDPARGDIYSLCSTLYHLLAGHPPFGSAAEGGLAALIDRILTQPPPPITRPDIPTHLTAAIIRGLAKDPTDRQPDARTLATQLTGVATNPRLPPTRHSTPDKLIGKAVLRAHGIPTRSTSDMPAGPAADPTGARYGSDVASLPPFDAAKYGSPRLVIDAGTVDSAQPVAGRSRRSRRSIGHTSRNGTSETRKHPVRPKDGDSAKAKGLHARPDLLSIVAILLVVAAVITGLYLSGRQAGRPRSEENAPATTTSTLEVQEGLMGPQSFEPDGTPVFSGEGSEAMCSLDWLSTDELETVRDAPHWNPAVGPEEQRKRLYAVLHLYEGAAQRAPDEIQPAVDVLLEQARLRVPLMQKVDYDGSRLTQKDVAGIDFEAEAKAFEYWKIYMSRICARESST